MKVFVLLSRVPWPLEKGDKLRAYHQLEHLSKKHEIFLCCLSDSSVHPDAESELRKISHHLEIIKLNKLIIGFRLLRALFSSKPFQVHYFYQSHAARKVNKLIDKFNAEHIYCQLIRASEYVKHHHHISKTLDYMDALNAGHRRRIMTAAFWMRPLLRNEANRLVRYENLIYDYFDSHTIISEQDKQLIYHSDRNKIVVVPNGVDTEYFHAKTSTKEYELVFTGNMSYPPNVDCARFVVKEVLPLLRKSIPKIRLLIAGASPSSEVKNLSDEGVVISGWIDDIREAYWKAQIFLAPMQIGTGVQNKLLEAMSCGLPCVTSPLSANAIQAAHCKQLLVSDKPAEIAGLCIELLNSEKLRVELSNNGREFVLKNYTWQSAVEKLDQLISG